MTTEKNINLENLAARFQMTIEMSNEAIFWIDKNGRFPYVNKQACHSLGYTRKELVGMSIWDIDPEFPRSIWSEHWNARRLGERNIFESIHLRKDGHIFPVEISSCLITHEGEDILAAFVRDISERKEAEKKLQSSEALYRSLFEYVPDGILLSDNKNHYLDANPAMCSMLGYSREELIKLVTGDIVAPHEIKNIEPLTKQLMETSELFAQCEYRRKDGSTFFAEFRSTLLPDGNYLSLVRDISERRNLEEQLQQIQKMESIGRLAGGIAHDFNNLLMPIIGYTELLMLKLPKDDPSNTSLDKIHQTALRAASLTRQILAFSRKQVLEMDVLDLNDVIRNFKSMIQRMIGEHIVIRTCFDSQPCFIKADKGQIEQVLLNLIINARDAMPEGGEITIETALIHLDQKYIEKHIESLTTGQHIMLAVTDTGHGMSPDVKKNIFEPFFTTKPQGQGTGLGLSTSFGIIKQHKGGIWVYSEPDKGTCFKIYLPVAGEKTKPDNKKHEKMIPSQGAETIMVVEDEEITRKFICETLEAYRYRVIEASNPIDALQKFTAAPAKIQLVLTDVIMPELNGRELYDQMHALHPEMKVLFMSGYTDNVIVHQGILDQGVNFIQKPFSIQSFINKIRYVLQQSEIPDN